MEHLEHVSMRATIIIVNIYCTKAYSFLSSYFFFLSFFFIFVKQISAQLFWFLFFLWILFVRSDLHILFYTLFFCVPRILNGHRHRLSSFYFHWIKENAFVISFLFACFVTVNLIFCASRQSSSHTTCVVCWSFVRRDSEKKSFVK